MVATGIAAVGAREDAATGIDFDTKRVASALGKNLVPPRLGVVPPDQLPHRVDGFQVDPRSLDVSGGCAALAGVEPAIGSPAQAVGDRV